MNFLFNALRYLFFLKMLFKSLVYCFFKRILLFLNDGNNFIVEKIISKCHHYTRVLGVIVIIIYVDGNLWYK